LRHAGERPDDIVVLMNSPSFSADAAADVRVEDLKEIAELLQLSSPRGTSEGEQRFAVLLQVVDERDGVEAEVGAGKLVGGAVDSILPHWIWSMVAVRNGWPAPGCSSRGARPRHRGVLARAAGVTVGFAEQPS